MTRTTTFDMTLTSGDFEIPVTVKIHADLARRPFAEDDGDEVEILTVRASEDILENGKFVFHAGDDVCTTEKMENHIREKFYEHLEAEREQYIADKWADAEGDR